MIILSNQITKLYKYRNFNEFTDSIILNSSLYFSAIKDFNDPFDCNLNYNQEYTEDEIRQYFNSYLKRNENARNAFDLEFLLEKWGENKKFVEFQNDSNTKLIDRVGVLALSSNYNNILMWSHYSNNHSGLVFEFNPLLDKNCFFNPLKVDYKTEYKLLSYLLEHEDEIPKLMLTKHIDWKYEDEFRIIDLEEIGEKKFKKEALSSIIFGEKAKKNDIKRMIQLCKSNGFNHIKFKQASLKKGIFGLNFREIPDI